jgi:hypothetical protein
MWLQNIFATQEWDSTQGHDSLTRTEDPDQLSDDVKGISSCVII